MQYGYWLKAKLPLHAYQIIFFIVPMILPVVQNITQFRLVYTFIAAIPKKALDLQRVLKKILATAIDVLFHLFYLSFF